MLQGRYYLERATGAANRKALECFSNAVALEPSYAEAHAYIAYMKAARSVLGFEPPHAAMSDAKAAALEAVGLDDSVSTVHSALAMILEFYDWDWEGSEREYRRALELDPGDSFSRFSYAQLLATAGRSGEAIREARRAIDVDPLSLPSRYMLALALCLARRFEEAASEARAGLELEANYQLLHLVLGWALAGQGKDDEAIASLRRANNIAPDDPLPFGYFTWALGVGDKEQEARSNLERLEERRRQGYVGGVFLALAHLGLGQKNQALSWLETAADDRDAWMTFLNELFVFDPLRSDPRFQDLVRAMNYPVEPQFPPSA